MNLVGWGDKSGMNFISCSVHQILLQSNQRWAFAVIVAAVKYKIVEKMHSQRLG
jgi:hypothetical protein